MNRRLLIFRTGSAACNGLIRSLRAADPELFIVGCHDDLFVLKKSLADRHYLIPGLSRPKLCDALNRITEDEQIDLVIPNSDADVFAIAALSESLRCRTFIPKKEVIEQCQDKYALTMFLAERGFPVPVTYPVSAVSEIESVFRRFPPRSRVWCRAREGTGSNAATPVDTPAQARAWIEYWRDMHDMAENAFTLSEYLPGRDFTVQCLFKTGTLLMAKMHQRLSYLTGGCVPSGVSSNAAVAKMVHDPEKLKLSREAILALDPMASGVYFVDLKENASGVACITEINAGRFANVPTIHDASGRDNMCMAYVHAALGDEVKIIAPRPYASDCYVIRDVDMPPVVQDARELLRDIHDAR